MTRHRPTAASTDTRRSSAMADRSGTVSADGGHRVHARELARAAWGLCLFLRPADTLRLLGDARPDRRARVTVRLLGARHAAQAVLSGPSPGPGLVALGGWTDAVHAASALALAALDLRRRRLALLDATVAGTWSLLGRRDLRRTPVGRSPSWRERVAGALVQHLPGAPSSGGDACDAGTGGAGVRPAGAESHLTGCRIP